MSICYELFGFFISHIHVIARPRWFVCCCAFVDCDSGGVPVHSLFPRDNKLSLTGLWPSRPRRRRTLLVTVLRCMPCDVYIKAGWERGVAPRNWWDRRTCIVVDHGVTASHKAPSGVGFSRFFETPRAHLQDYCYQESSNARTHFSSTS